VRPLKLPHLADPQPTTTASDEMLALDIPTIARLTTLSVRHLRRLDSSRDILRDGRSRHRPPAGRDPDHRLGAMGGRATWWGSATRCSGLPARP